MQTENSLSPQDSLRLITETIQKTRENLGDMSFGFLLWGWIVAIAALGEYVLWHYVPNVPHFLPWPILSILGAITTILYYRRQNQKSATETHLSFFLSQMWIVLGVSFFMVVFLSLKQGVVPAAFTLLLAGIGTLITGLTIRFRPMQIGGVAFFIAAIIATFVDDSVKPLVISAGMAVGYLIPGYLLRAKKA